MAAPEWEGIRLPSVLATTGTPALIVSERRLRENIRGLRRGFRTVWPSTTLRYCAKTNPDLNVLRIVREEGLDVMVSHAAEARLAIAAGFAPEQIAWQRPVTDANELDAAIRAGVRRVHAFRRADLDALGSIAAAHRCRLHVSLRIALGRPGMFLLAGAARRLGFDPGDAEAIRVPEGGIVIDALNTYIGTQQENPAAFRAAIRRLAQLAVLLRSQGHPIEELNLGGGIPSNSLRRLTVRRLLSRSAGRIDAASPEGYAATVADIFREELRRADPSFAPRLVMEPGRAIVGNAVLMLTRVAAEQGRWRFLDCGRNVLVESPLAFTRWIAPVAEPCPETARIHLSGPTLNTLDIIDMHRRLPAVRTGDVLAVGDAGAYTLSRGTSYAGSVPAVWLARSDGSLTCIRRAESWDDVPAPMPGAAV